MSERTFELHRALWRDDLGWRLVRQWLDPQSGLLAAFSQHDTRDLLKADLFHQFEQGFHDKPDAPRWESIGCVESLFAADDFDGAIRHLEAAIRDRLPPATH